MVERELFQRWLASSSDEESNPQTDQLLLFPSCKKAQERNVQSLTNLAVPESA